MAAETKSRKQCDPYMKLIQRFPLRPIENDDEHEQAVEIIGEFMGRELDSGTSGYLDTLILLVNKYEDENHTPGGACRFRHQSFGGDRIYRKAANRSAGRCSWPVDSPSKADINI